MQPTLGQPLDNSATGDRQTVTTIAKALSLLDLFSEARPLIGLTEFQKLAQRDKATTYRHLQALEHHGLIEQDPRTRAYRLGHTLDRLADMRRRTVREVDTVAPIIDMLSQASGELVHLSRLMGHDMQQIYHADLGTQAVRVGLESDLVLPLLTSSSGKAILSFLPSAALDDIIAQQHSRFGCPPMPSGASIKAVLRTAAQRGYINSIDTLEVGVSSVAIPVFDRTEQPIAACSIAYPTARGSEAKVDMLAELLATHGPDLTDRMGGTVPSSVLALWSALAAREPKRKSA